MASLDTPHALAPDLAEIHALAERPTHDRAEEARRALAIYERVCWRLALVAFPGRVLAAVRGLEAEASGLLRRYASGGVAPAAFWAEFGRLVSELDAHTAEVDAGSQDMIDAGRALRGLRVRVAEAALPATWRLEVQHLLDVMAEALEGLHLGKLDTPAFWAIFRRGEAGVAEALSAAAAASRDAETPVARLNRAAAAIDRLSPPGAARTAIAGALSALVADWQAGRPLSEAALDDLEGLLERAARFQAAHGEAVERLEAREKAIAERPLPPPTDAEGSALLETLHGLVTALEAGRLEPDVFEARFEAAWARLDELVRLADDAPAPWAEASRLAERARARVAEASLPRFVRHTALELLGQLERSLDEQRAEPKAPEAFWGEVRGELLDLEVTLGLGRDVVHEKTAALRRYEALEARVGHRAFAPMLAGPVADLLETLRELLHRLDLGLFPLSSFHRVFDEHADRLEKLLVWQAALDAAAR